MLTENLKKYRTLAQLSQKEIAKQLHISQQGYGNYESGKASPDPERLAKIAQILNCNIEDLIGTTKRNNNSDTLLVAAENPLLNDFGIEPKSYVSCSPKEELLLLAYRLNPEMQPAIDKILGITDNNEDTEN